MAHFMTVCGVFRDKQDSVIVVVEVLNVPILMIDCCLKAYSGDRFCNQDAILPVLFDDGLF